MSRMPWVRIPRGAQLIFDAKVNFLGNAMIYDDLFAETTRGHELYEGLPLADVSFKKRGDILEGVVRRHDERTSPDAIFADPAESLSVNGRKRGRNTRKYDYLRDAVRVEVKASILCWNTPNNHWELKFKNVKRAEHDELRLAVYLPDGIRIFLHGGAHYSTHGVATASSGGKIHVCGPCHEEDWRVAFESMRPKLGTFVATIPFPTSMVDVGPFNAELTDTDVSPKIMQEHADADVLAAQRMTADNLPFAPPGRVAGRGSSDQRRVG
jgi:hypothetical protein